MRGRSISISIIPSEADRQRNHARLPSPTLFLVQADEVWQRGHVGVAPRLLIGPDAHPP